MTDKLEHEIRNLLISQGCFTDEIKTRLTLIISHYNIEEIGEALTLRTCDINGKFIQSWLIAKKVKGCTEQTLRYYRQVMTLILQEIGKPADEITTNDLRIYLAYRELNGKVTKTTLNNELRVMSSFFKHLHQEDIIRKDPTLKLDAIKTKKEKKQAFSDIEVERLRGACRNAREKLIVELLLSTGCRVSEAVGIRLDEIQGTRCLVHGKGNKDRFVYFNAKTMYAIEQYMSERKDKSVWLFPGGNFGTTHSKKNDWYRHKECVNESKHLEKGSLESFSRSLGKRAGVTDTHPHRFRRTCATLSLRNGMPIEYVSKMLGHDSISTTQIYLDISDSDLEKYHELYVR